MLSARITNLFKATNNIVVRKYVSALYTLSLTPHQRCTLILKIPAELGDEAGWHSWERCAFGSMGTATNHTDDDPV